MSMAVAVMPLSDYQVRQQRKGDPTAIYPGQGTSRGLIYCGLGLGELGEAQGKAKKILRDDSGRLTPERRAALLDELGDSLWYVAAICNELELSLEEIASKAIGITNNDDLYMLMLEIGGVIGNMQRSIAAYARNTDAWMRRAHVVEIRRHIQTYLFFLSLIADELDSSVYEIATLNLLKIDSRVKRGAIHGDGDNR
jgi:NTP pyrophosphatase (non-canonical NTP hydrolase)